MIDQKVDTPQPHEHVNSNASPELSRASAASPCFLKGKAKRIHLEASPFPPSTQKIRAPIFTIYISSFYCQKMGSWNPFSTTDASNPSAPTKTSDGAFIAPDRTSRAKCYEARDAFFKCLDKAEILDSLAEEEKAGKACGGLDREMGRECAASWVGHLLFILDRALDVRR